MVHPAGGRQDGRTMMRPGWLRRRARSHSLASRHGLREQSWLQLGAAALPGVAALIALIFTYQQVRAVGGQLAETRSQIELQSEGLLIDRFNSAISNLGSPQTDVRLGGIYSLQQIMSEYRSEQPTVVEILSAYIKDHAPAVPDPNTVAETAPGHGPASDIQAAAMVLGERSPAYDKQAVVALSYTYIFGGNFGGANLPLASFYGAQLPGSNFTQADLRKSDFTQADLFATLLAQTDLRDAIFNGADLVKADLKDADLAGSTFSSVTFGKLVIPAANLSNADLAGANLSGADLAGVNLEGADLAGAVMRGANIANANFNGAALNGVVGLKR